MHQDVTGLPVTGLPVQTPWQPCWYMDSSHCNKLEFTSGGSTWIWASCTSCCPVVISFVLTTALYVPCICSRNYRECTPTESNMNCCCPFWTTTTTAAATILFEAVSKILTQMTYTVYSSITCFKANTGQWSIIQSSVMKISWCIWPVSVFMCH